jgi:hypothetical protein
MINNYYSLLTGSVMERKKEKERRREGMKIDRKREAFIHY